MNPETMRKKLLALRERLTSQQASLKSESGRFTARAPINMAENASDEQELDVIASRLTASSQTLSDIDEAIGRIDAGKYNVCDDCAGEIGERRLSAQPWARLCVACQRKAEEEGS